MRPPAEAEPAWSLVSVRTPAVPVAVWPARPSHLPALLRLLDRCSDDTLYRRFHGIAGPAARREMQRVANPVVGHRSWVAMAGGEVRGTITLATGRDGHHEIGVLVEDAWFRQGLGRLLADAMTRDARSRGVPELVASLQSDNHRAREFFRALAPDARTAFEDGEVVVRIPLVRPVHPARPTPVPGALRAG